MGGELPLVGRVAELGLLTDVLNATKAGEGRGALVVGEAGVGKSRLLREAHRQAMSQGLSVFAGTATENCAAYRPLVDAFARAALPHAHDSGLSPYRPTFARLFPGWVGVPDVQAPMADPAAVLAEALIALAQAIAPDGAVLVLDDMQWADDDTLSVVTYLVNSIPELPFALLLAARSEPHLPVQLASVTAPPNMGLVPVRRLANREVVEAFHAAQLDDVRPETIDQLAIAVDGLPLVLDEFVRQLRANPGAGTKLDIATGTFGTAVRLRLGLLSSTARAVHDALSVLGEARADVLAAAAGLDEDQVATALREGLASSLLVAADTSLGVDWRHRLMQEVIQDLLLPWERRRIARRAAEYALRIAADLDDGELRRAASWCELAGQPELAAQQLVRAARGALRGGGLDAAEQCLTQAQALCGSVLVESTDVLIERINLLTLSGRAVDAYASGASALRHLSGDGFRRVLVTAARAAVAAGLHTEASTLLARLDQDTTADDPDIAVILAQVACVERRPEAVALSERAAALAVRRGRFDVASEAWISLGNAARRYAPDAAVGAFETALALSSSHGLSIWRVAALQELGALDMSEASDPTRLWQARELATTAGMAGLVAKLDLHIGLCTAWRDGFVPAYPIFVRADTQARQLHLVGLHAQTRAAIVQCLVHADDHPLPGRPRPAKPSEVDDVLEEALALGRASTAVDWARATLGTRAWFRDGDHETCLRMVEETLIAEELRLSPWWGVTLLLRTLSTSERAETPGTVAPADFVGHHANRAALAYARAVVAVRNGLDPLDLIEEAESHVRDTAFARHFFRTIVAPTLCRAVRDTAVGWLREADAFCATSGERGLQRRVRHALSVVGAKALRSPVNSLAPSLARLGLTPREAEVLSLVNAGLSNADIADALFISVRTVESHVSSLLSKSGCVHREQLPAIDPDGR